MATAQENLARFQAISDRGLQDQLPPDKRARFDEAIRRGLLTQTQEQPFDLERFDPAGPVDVGQGPRPEFTGAAIVEPVAAIASGLAGTVAGGLIGGGIAATPGTIEGAGADISKQIQTALSFTPKTRAGQESLDNIGTIMKGVVDRFNVPIAGISGLIELISGQGIDQATETATKIRDQGLSKVLGDRVLEETGSPAAATLAATAPTAVLEILGLKGGGAAVRAGQRTAQTVGEAAQELAVKTGDVIQEAVPPAVQATQQVVEGVTGFQKPATRELAQEIQAGTVDPAAAGLQVKPPRTFEGDPTGIERFFDTRGPKIEKDPLGAEAVKQGFDPGVIQPLKRSSGTDKIQMQKMVSIAERSKKDKLFGLKNRPGDVAGDALMNKVRIVRDANKRAGLSINREANKLRGQPVDVTGVSDKFLNDLSELGITVTDDLKLDFKGSDIEFQGGPKSTIRNVFSRMTGAVPDARAVHELKRLIDSEVTYGKTLKGLAGGPERALKQLRAGLDEVLDTKFPDYDKANIAYRDTISALDALQTVAGKRMDLTGPNADKATGTLMRRLMSNAQSRVNLLDALDDIEQAIKAHGGSDRLRIEGKKGEKGPADNLEMLVLFADELDAVFGPAARTSLQGQFDQALKQGVSAATSKAGLVDLGLTGLGKVADKVQGINEAGQFKAIKELLKRNK